MVDKLEQIFAGMTSPGSVDLARRSAKMALTLHGTTIEFKIRPNGQSIEVWLVETNSSTNKPIRQKIGWTEAMVFLLRAINLQQQL